MRGPTHLTKSCSASRHSRPARWTPTCVVRISISAHVFVVLALLACPEWWPWLLAAVLSNHLFLGALVMSPRDRLLGANLVTLPRSSRENGFVALTFDD